MKKIKLTLVCACFLSSAILFNSCIGSFSLFNRVLSWNQGVGSKFVNELVFVALCIVPVYEISALADVLVLNSIEFWSGNNPVANGGDIKKVKGENGDYTVETTEDGYSISNGEQSMKLVFNNETNVWSVVAEDIETDLFKINNDGTADLYLPTGDAMNITLDAQGLMAARQVTMNNYYFASR
ncbi:DUF3332 domain-containing protein [Bacteroides sp. 224]|uniref:DUF3332 domain-containing protein n=1 Tax=Bacteroides sp. 224 TaxID=2302936 RepID=UPI0013CF8177|nr:DUF3332 domain-containing protein [Bacteroides sp. 224]NDV64349.1 DUF3332 domain-containing protein [Bacteroides sp. 224]